MRKSLWLGALVFVVIAIGVCAQLQTPSLTSSPAPESVQTPSHDALTPETSSEQPKPDTSSPMIVVFLENGCSQCEIMDSLLDELLLGHEDVSVTRYDINAPGSTKLQWELAAHYGIIATTLPVIFAGDRVIVGSGSSQEIKLRSAVSDCIQRGCDSPLEHVKQGRAVITDLLTLGAFIGLFIALLVLQVHNL